MPNFGGRPSKNSRIPGTSVMRFDSPSQVINQTSRASCPIPAPITPTNPPASTNSTTASPPSPSSPANSVVASEVDNNEPHDAQLVLIDDYAPIAENGYIRWTALTLNALLSVMAEGFDRIMDSADSNHKKLIHSNLFEELKEEVTSFSGDHPDQVSYLNFFLCNLTVEKMKSKWKTMVSNYKKIHDRVILSGASRPEIDWAYYDDIGKIVKGDPSIIPPFVYETMDVGVTGAGRITAHYFEYLNEGESDDNAVNPEEINYDLPGQIYLELEGGGASASASTQESPGPTTPGPTTPPPSSIATNTPSTRTTAGIGIGRGRRSVLDVEQVRNVLTDLDTRSAETTKDILDGFVTKIDAKLAKRKREYDQAEERSVFRQAAMIRHLDKQHEETITVIKDLLSVNRSVLNYAARAYETGRRPELSTPLPDNNETNNNNNSDNNNSNVEE
ncbi:hypothetical protein INT45_005211 [Circinella minor]|uniref:Myb/SANT-like domain-containing protein n=1 Tax=Circinella minor TaxID=1195481 RepID=A0A8H7VIG7_9FUNG|nr:hypothetical protein INT45_005211 [Circinella minor]